MDSSNVHFFQDCQKCVILCKCGYRIPADKFSSDQLSGQVFHPLDDPRPGRIIIKNHRNFFHTWHQLFQQFHTLHDVLLLQDTRDVSTPRKAILFRGCIHTTKHKRAGPFSFRIGVANQA